MPRTAAQAQAATALASLGARAPWCTLTAAGRDLINADARVVLTIIPTGQGAAVDHALAEIVATAINTLTGTDGGELDYQAAVRVESARFRRNTRPQAAE